MQNALWQNLPKRFLGRGTIGKQLRDELHQCVVPNPLNTAWPVPIDIHVKQTVLITTSVHAPPTIKPRLVRPRKLERTNLLSCHKIVSFIVNHGILMSGFYKINLLWWYLLFIFLLTENCFSLDTSQHTFDCKDTNLVSSLEDVKATLFCARVKYHIF